MRAQGMRVFLCVAVFVVLAGCTPEPPAKQAEPVTPPPAPEESAPEAAAAPVAPETSTKVETEEGWEQFEQVRPVSGSASPSGVGQSVPEEPVADAPAVDLAAGEVLVKDSCASCHKIDKIEAHAKEELDEEPWNVIVTRMVDENEAKISPEDQKTIIAYLEAKYGK